MSDLVFPQHMIDYLAVWVIGYRQYLCKCTVLKIIKHLTLDWNQCVSRVLEILVITAVHFFEKLICEL